MIVDNVDLTGEQIERELVELIGEDEDKVDQQESEMVINEDEDRVDQQESVIVINEGEGKAKKEPKIKKPFIPLTKEEIDKLSRREQFAYKIELSKFLL